MSIVTLAGGATTMTTREIAELTGKEHRHVLRDVEVLRSNLGELFVGYAQTWTHPQNGQTYPEFLLDKDTTLCLVSGYDAVVRMKIIKRWQELEAQQQAFNPASLSRLDILKLAIEAEQRAVDAEAERDKAIATKAHIGNSREATAMATASAASRKAAKLQIELDRSKEFATVKRMEMLYHGIEFKWRLLKETSAAMGVPAIDVFDANYGTVKAYHSSVWREAYAVEIH